MQLAAAAAHFAAEPFAPHPCRLTCLPLCPSDPLQFKLLDVLPTTPACVSAAKSQALNDVVACADYCLLNQWSFQVRGAAMEGRR